MRYSMDCNSVNHSGDRVGVPTSKPSENTGQRNWPSPQERVAVGVAAFKFIVTYMPILYEHPGYKTTHS
jgi:hypothetical protein